MNTRNKRASALGFALAALVVLPAPDATIDQADRQQAAFSYAGILAAAATPGPVGIVIDRERLSACTVTDALTVSAIRAKVTPCSVIEGMD